MKSLVVLITGSSKGIGQEIALQLANDPHRRFKVYATMRNMSSRQGELKTKAGYSFDDTLLIRELDVTKQETIDKAVKDIVDSEGRIDVLGLMTPLWWETAPMESFYDIMDVNYFGCVRMTKAVVPYMKEKRSGRILQVSSVVGLKAIPVVAQYIASKFALEGFSESIAPPLRKFNVWVSVVQVGPTTTEMAKQFGADPTAIFETFSKEIPEDTRDIVEQMLISNQEDVLGGELQLTDDIAKLVQGIIISDNPSFRYQSSPKVEEIGRQRLLDVTGNKTIDTWLKQ